MADTPAGERLQKILANAGLASRREIERWIADGRIMVNDQPAKLGDRATSHDTIKVDGKPLGQKRLAEVERHIIMYNKPEGEIVSRKDPSGKKTVFSRLPKLPRGRWISVGRLDVNSAGLLLLTTDGELANRLMHPKTQIEREYAVRVFGEVKKETVTQLVNGVELEDGPARFEDVVASGGEGSNSWFHVVIMEGRNREVRRLWDAVGLLVNRLKRVRFGPIILDSSVKSGQWRELNAKERKELLEVVGIKKDTAPGQLYRHGDKRKPISKSPQSGTGKREFYKRKN